MEDEDSKVGFRIYTNLKTGENVEIDPRFTCEEDARLEQLDELQEAIEFFGNLTPETAGGMIFEPGYAPWERRQAAENRLVETTQLTKEEHEDLHGSGSEHLSQNGPSPHQETTDVIPDIVDSPASVDDKGETTQVIPDPVPTPDDIREGILVDLDSVPTPNDTRETTHTVPDPVLDDDSGLPSGWEMGMTPDYQPFFIDHNTMSTTFDDPRLPSKLDANEPAYKHIFRRKLIEFQSEYELEPKHIQCGINVRRKYIFDDSIREITKHDPKTLKGSLEIKFDGEEGIDFGGLSREYFYLLSHELFNPIFG